MSIKLIILLFLLVLIRYIECLSYSYFGLMPITAFNLAATMRYEKKQILVQLIGELDPTLRTTIILKYYEDMKISEIATIMKCPAGTVKNRLNTAKKLLSAKAKNGISHY